MLAGLILSVIGCPSEKLSSIRDISSNLDHLAAGFEFARLWGLAGRFPVEARAPAHCMFDGNQALALGALLGGCQFMAGYPMTPATSIMHYLATVALDHPVHFEQAEDEISAVNMALGASYAGLRSLVATSGGGFALMQEGVSLAGMTETPVVVIVAQRPGPATGLPTRTEQGDLNFVLHAGHGEFPRAIYAPGSLHEAMTLARKSFDVADRCQTPVFILTDQYLADSVQMMTEEIPPEVTRREYASFDASYRRYSLTPSGVSPLACPGTGEALVKVDSDEHDEEGKITEDLGLRSRMVEKRLKKFDLLKEDCVMPTFTGDRSAGVIVISWGSNRMIVEEAVRRLIAGGKSAGALHFSQVYPLTKEMLSPWDLAGKRIIAVENNATGQFAGLLKRELGLEVHHRVLKYSGECFTAKELCQALGKYFT
jgi:2-oxoglutarate ferredoxin oxidoreductase subunit alpha